MQDQLTGSKIGSESFEYDVSFCSSEQALAQISHFDVLCFYLSSILPSLFSFDPVLYGNISRGDFGFFFILPLIVCGIDFKLIKGLLSFHFN